MQNYWNHWLASSVSPVEKKKVEEIGNLLGLKSEGGELFGSNFERGLILRQILRDRRPRRVLELGTGRGLGTICMADCATSENLGCTIETIDCIPSDRLQRWPHEKNGTPVEEDRALREFWASEFPGLERAVICHNGATEDVLTKLRAQGAVFDFVFLDAAHDLRSVFLDLAGALALIRPGGCLLMDDFAPLEAFGLATCIAANHARSFFGAIEIIRSEGAVFPSRLPEPQWRSMVFLSERNNLPVACRPSALRVIGLRAAGRLIDWLFSPGAFRF